MRICVLWNISNKPYFINFNGSDKVEKKKIILIGIIIIVSFLVGSLVTAQGVFDSSLGIEAEG